MSRAFAMLVEDVIATKVRGPQFLLSGFPLGRAPEVSDAFLMVSPFSKPLRVHCTSVLGQPRGASDMRFTCGIEGDLGLAPRQCIGALLVDEGVAIRAFSGCLRQHVPKPYNAPARFNLGKDRAWGLVSIRGRIVNIVIVGGGLATSEDFWPLLQKIEIQMYPDLDLSFFERVSPGFEYTGVWRLPTIRTYPRGEWESALVLRPSGPVTLQSSSAFIDGARRFCRLYQQRDGLTQVWVESAPGMDMETLIVPLGVAA